MTDHPSSRHTLGWFRVTFIYALCICTTYSCNDVSWLTSSSVSWQVEDVESHGFSRAKLDGVRKRLADEGTKALLVVHRNAIVYEWYAPELSPTKRHSSASIAKSIIGGFSLMIAMSEGTINLDDPAWQYISAWKTDPDRSGITIRQLVTHTSGISNGVDRRDDPSASWAARFWNKTANPFEVALYEAPLEAKPGDRFVYSSPGFGALGYAIAAAMRNQDGHEDVKKLLKSRIMHPLGIPDGAWTMAYRKTFELDGLTLYPNWGGSFFTARALARLGQLMVDRGRWKGKQLLKSFLVELAMSDLGRTEGESVPVTHGFGWRSNWRGIWSSLPQDASAALGSSDQILLVIPSLDLVLVRFGESLPSLPSTPPWIRRDQKLFKPVIDALNLQRATHQPLLSNVAHVSEAAVEPRPRQVTINTRNRAWLFRHSNEPYFLAGPGDPEDFLYRGTRNDDGTRKGDQRLLINKLKQTGANSIYLQAVRSHGGDGDSSHNPFIDNDPAKGINTSVLDQWESWFSEMDDNDILIYFFFYDDSTNVWPTGDHVGNAERAFLRTIVDRFEHHANLIWVIAEEYQEAFTPQRVSRIAEAIRRADDFNHAIAVHKLEGISFAEFARDPNIDQFAIQSPSADYATLHQYAVTAWHNASGRYNNVFAETPDWGTGAQARKRAWSVAMGGAYVMVFGMNIADTPIEDLRDLGNLVKFMTSTDFYRMAPHDELAGDDRLFVLANPGDAYIVYGDETSNSIGLSDMRGGYYSFAWFDIVKGEFVNRETIRVKDGKGSWSRPSIIDGEFAVYIKRIEGKKN